MPFKQIMVNAKVHGKVKKIAKSNNRSVAGQVQHWAENDCDHPLEMREEKVYQVSVPDGKGLPTKTLRISYCKKCRQHLFCGTDNELAGQVTSIVES